VHELSRTQPLASDVERIAQLECDNARLVEKLASSTESVGEFRFWQVAKLMV
jgi:hypothetical protein